MTVSIKDLSRAELVDHSEYDGHHRVMRFEDNESGLLGFIAIHRRRGALSTGGTRYVFYANESSALRDALRLSSAMTSKCIISGLSYGGAKSVIMAKSVGDVKSNEQLTAYAEVVESLDGTFRTGEDVGMTEADVQFLISKSNFFNGKSDRAGDPSRFAAQSVALVMDRISRLHLNASARELSVAIKGVGKVGSELASILSGSGAKVSIADIDKQALLRVHLATPGLSEFSPEEIAFIPSDIYAPCALGNEVNADTAHRFTARIICGGANNQLASPLFAETLDRLGVLYVPDFLANAGGLINVSDELEPDGYHGDRVKARIAALGDTAELLYRASRTSRHTFANVVEDYVRAHA